MFILGFHGGLAFSDEEATGMGWPFNLFHDASAVLIHNGSVIAGAAQERFDRIKHSNAFPIEAIQFCLDTAGIDLSQVSYFAFPNKERVMDTFIANQRQEVTRGRALPLNSEGLGSREVLLSLLARAFGISIPKERLIFVNHHIAHAYAAFAASGFKDTMVYVRDGWGDNLSGIVVSCDNGVFDIVDSSSPKSSLGNFYLTGTEILGYHLGDEYKIMGLAPHGDPERYRSLIEQNIKYRDRKPIINFRGLWEDFTNAVNGVRPRNAPFEDRHQDVAAAFQKALEELTLSDLSQWQEQIGHQNLCLAGGVAQNSSLNGKLLRSRLFKNIFVHAAPDDGGLALGAALVAHNDKVNDDKTTTQARCRHVFWGTEIAAGNALDKHLEPWRPFLQVEHVPEIQTRAAKAIANGEIIGWARGRSEFGPRALGNRSILADPRPPENRTRINEIVKQRESFRPFAPAVTEEAACKIFDIDHFDDALAFMNFVVPVRNQYRSILGAITHIDGSARIQTVSQYDNPTFWRLIKEFSKLTGIPVLLNTSFNNNAEPIVETVEDVIACFLTTDIDSLVLGNYWIQKACALESMYDELTPHLAIDCALEASEGFGGKGRRYFIRSKRTYGRRAEIDENTYYNLAHPRGQPFQRKGTAERMLSLWRKRLIRMEPKV